MCDTMGLLLVQHSVPAPAYKALAKEGQPQSNEALTMLSYKSHA